MSSSPPLVVADRYRLVAPLGQGGMGRVWRATDVVLHRDVAIKELVPPPGLTPAERQEMRERSLREARAIARLNNINVVRVFDVLRTDADPWIVMEYVPSRSLHDTLASDGPFNPVRAAEIGLGVLGALRAAHRAGVVHRDVKPGNVLVGADGRVVLTDFGLATVPGDPNVTRTGLVLGSPAYIAPERARDGTAGPAADLWSLGATLYAAVEGSSPFARPSAIATLAALATENPPPARNAGPLKPVLNGLLRKDPTHRINADEAERLLLRAAGRRSKLTFPMSPTMRRPGVGRERPMLPPTGATPVVPGPRPPVAPPRPSGPPGQTPVPGGRGGVGDSRPPVFVPGKAPVGRSDDKPTRVDRPKVDASPLDPTRVDGPPVRDGRPPFGTRQTPPAPPAPHDVDPGLARTVRGGPGGFTAADVAANRRRKVAPEHEKSLADAAAAMAGATDATTVVPPGVDRSRPGRRPAEPMAADATTVVPPAGKSRGRTRTPSADATTVVPASPTRGRKPTVTPPADATTVVPPPAAEPVVEAAPAESAPAEAAAAAPAEPAAEAAAAIEAPTAPPDVEDAPAETPEPPGESASQQEAETSAAEQTPAKPVMATRRQRRNRTKAAPVGGKAGLAEVQPQEGRPEAAAQTAEAAAPAAAEAGTGEPTVEETEAKPTVEDAEAEAEAAAGTASEPEAPAAEPAQVDPEPAQGDVEKAEPTAGSADDPADPIEDLEDDQPAQLALPLSRKPAAPVETGDEQPAVPAELPPFSPAARPAWRPMQVRTPVRRNAGITVFGTRLTFRQAAVGAAALLVILVLVVVLAVQAFGGDDKPTAGPTGKPTTAGRGTTAPAGAAPTGSSRPSTTSNSQPTSTATTTTPVTGGAITLPAGWKWYSRPTENSWPGFTIPIPQNAAITPAGSQIYLRWSNRLLIVDRTNAPQSDPVKDWQNQEANRTYRNYHRIKIVPVSYFKAGADWEFTYTTDRGNAQHADKRNILVSASAAYSINWYTTPEDWAVAQHDIQLIYQGFQPKP